MYVQKVRTYRINKLVSQDGTECYVAYGKGKWNQWLPLKITEEDILSGRATAFQDKERLLWYMTNLWDQVPRFSPYSTLKNMVHQECVETIQL